MDCIFCKIAEGATKTPFLYADDQVVAFDDLHPKAPQHKLIIPKKHIATVNDIQEKDLSLVGHMIAVAKDLAAQLEIAESGYRLLFNCNRDGGQVIFHLHLHLLGGRNLHWPPG